MEMFKGWFPFWLPVLTAMLCVAVVLIAVLPEPDYPDRDIFGSLTSGETLIIHKVSESDLE